MLNWLSRYNERMDWTIRQLDLQPHQYLLEVGCGSGRLLAAVANQAHRSFIAAIEPSITRYRQAARRNQLTIRKDTVQLHHGQLHDLPYPASYFHTIYGSGSYYSWNNLVTECLRLGNLLRANGRLVLFSQPGRYRSEDDLRTEAARLQAAFLQAGLTAIHTEYRHFPPGTCLAVTGVKQAQDTDYHQTSTVNNRLLNPGASFISKVARIQ